MKKIAILLTSRNNYEMIHHWFESFDQEGFEVYNIDDGSLPEKLQEGRSICEQYNIHFIESDQSGVQANMKVACESLKDSVDWILWFQHDCNPLSKNFMSKLNKIVTENDLSDVATIGFNGLHSHDNRNFVEGNTALHHTARAPIQPGNKWYRRDNPVLDYSKFDKNRAFVIEIVCWFAIMVNVDKYLTEIEVDNNFGFHQAFDDVSMQFLNKNLYNICIPWLVIGHDQIHKRVTNIQHSSATISENQKVNYSGDIQATRKHWIDKWKFKYANEVIGYSDQCKKLYEGTLIGDFFKHSPANGPLKYYPLQNEELR